MMKVTRRLRGTRNGRDRGPPMERRRGAPLTLSFEEAAGELLMRPRTLVTWLKKTQATCLVRGPTGRLRLDRKGFYRWCRRMGFESAIERGGV